MEQKIINRLRRLRGQIERLEQEILNKEPCDGVLLQFSAIKGATTAAFKSYVESSLTQCDTTDRKKVQQLITTLIQS